MTDSHSPAGLRWALRLYPARYRAEHGTELSAIFAEATEGAGRLARLREALDVAGQGLRLRTGLGSDRTAGQILALAAPLTVALAAGTHVRDLLWMSGGGIQVMLSAGMPWPVILADQFLLALVWPAALLAVWFGRWTAARLLAVLALLVRILDVTLMASTLNLAGGYTIAAGTLLTALLTTGVVLAAPRDLLGSSRAQRVTVTGVAALAVALWTAQEFIRMPVPLGERTSMAWVLVLAAALLLAGRDRLPAAGLALAVLPAVVGVTLLLLHPLLAEGSGAVLLLAAAALVPALRARRSRAGALPPSAA